MKRGRQKDIGFTLIELLVVIAIIGILAAMLLPALSVVDRHVSYIKMFWSPAFQLTTACYDPPGTYNYRWSAD